ncbi:DUF4893 domain-containing protein [Arvimicrobium flavum]|uniref:DUF4893 domain-containing protein n=1 Tax=Arvimicrobium flavum TaxID=3393320 RepID=UPI00237B5900|nr:DUF4893 domain-containing protein [Mesorhizobium shangrilense]
MNLRACLLTLLVLLPAAEARADGEIMKLITPADRIRLDNYGETRRQALAEAKGDDDSMDRSALEASLAKPLQKFSGFDMTGDWQCRTTKLGGLSPIVVYGWFRCRVTDDGSGWRLEKLSGSQRTIGRFFDDGDKRLVYLGSQFVAGEKPKHYGAGPETDQAGYAFRTGAKEWRIEFPAPHYESRLDVLEFRR